MDQNETKRSTKEWREYGKKQRHFCESFFALFLLNCNADGLGFLFKFKWDKISNTQSNSMTKLCRLPAAVASAVVAAAKVFLLLSMFNSFFFSFVGSSRLDKCYKYADTYIRQAQIAETMATSNGNIFTTRPGWGPFSCYFGLTTAQHTDRKSRKENQP